MLNRPIKVAVYCRVGHPDQLAADNQVRLMRQYAQELGINDLSLYVDNGYSGTSLERPAFSQMNADIRADAFHAVLTLDYARIARSYQLFNQWTIAMREMGIRVMYAKQPDNDAQALIRQNLTHTAKKKKAFSD